MSSLTIVNTQVVVIQLDQLLGVVILEIKGCRELWEPVMKDTFYLGCRRGRAGDPGSGRQHAL